jgi:membrane protein DedA with SNARE-associated domain
MDFRWYSLFTILGSGIWSGILCWLGIKAGQDAQLMKGQYHQIALWVAGAMLALGAAYYFFVHRQMKATAK